MVGGSIDGAASGLPDKHYRAFISYSQQDKDWAKRIHSWLETYRVPPGAVPRAQLPRRLGRFFRDDEDMAAASDIAVIVRRAIDDAECLIVICSPRSAQSKWVNAEIQLFRRTHRAEKIFAVIIDGMPNSGDPKTECFPPALRASGDSDDPDALPIEPLGLDVRKDGRDKACTRLAAGMLGVDFDDLWQRERRRVTARRVVTAGAGLALAGVLAVSIGFGVQAMRSASSARSMSIDFLKSRAENEVAKGRYARGARYALAGLRVAPSRTADFWPVLAGAMFLDNLDAGIMPEEDAPRDRVFSPDGRFVLIDNRSRTGLELFSNSSLRPLATIMGADGMPPTAVFSANTARLVSLAPDGFVSVWRVSDGKRLRRMNLRSTEPHDIVISPDGARLAIISASGGVSLYSTDDLRRIAVLAAPSVSGPAVAFSMDGSRVAVGVPGVITILRASDAKAVATAKWPGTAILSLVFSRDGARLLAGGDDGIAREWSSADGAQLTTYGEAGDHLWKVGYSPDGATLMLNYGTRAELWARTDRKRRVVLGSDDGQIADFAFNRDGSRIAIADYAGKAQVWNAADGRLVADLGSQFGAVYGIQFGSKDDEIIIESANLGVRRLGIRALMLPLQDLVRDACNTLLGREDQRFTQQEIDAEAALRTIWPTSDQSVCEGEIELTAESGQVGRPPPARPARPLGAGRAAFDETLSLCARMIVVNAPPANADSAVETYSPLVKVGDVTLAVAPAPGACLSGGFGVRDRRMHKGLDFQEGGPIVAGGDGRVVEMKYRADYGNMVLIDHGHDVFTRYAHLESFETGLAVGGQVTLGQRIGTMGNTADYAIPMHLHYELLLGDYDGPMASFGLTPHSPFEYPPAK